MVGDRVVLLGEQRVEQREPDPVVSEKPVRSTPLSFRSVSSGASVLDLSFLSSPERSPRFRSSVDLQICERSHQWVTVLTKVGGRLLLPVRVRSGVVALTFMTSPSGQSSFGGSSTSMKFGVVLSVPEPVVVLNWDLRRRRAWLQRGRRLELVAQQQPVRDPAGSAPSAAASARARPRSARCDRTGCLPCPCRGRSGPGTSCRRCAVLEEPVGWSAAPWLGPRVSNRFDSRRSSCACGC